MKVVCKSFPKIVNGIERDSDPNIIIGKSYEVISKVMKSKILNLYMLTIMGEQGPCNYWSDYFYPLKETRKMKLNEIYEKTRIRIKNHDKKNIIR